MKRRFLILFSLALVLSLSSCGQKTEKPKEEAVKTEKKIEYLINRNEVTFRIAYNLVNRDLRFPLRPNPVRDTLESYFSDHKNDKIVKTLQKADIGYDDVLTQYLIHQREFPEFGPKHDHSRTIKEMELDGNAEIDTLYLRIYKELYDFYQNANVEKFLTDMEFYYTGAMQEIKAVASRYDVIQQMEDYCRMENFRYIVSPEPLFLTGGSRGIGPKVPTDSGFICYQFISPSPNIDLKGKNLSESSTSYGYADKGYIRKILVHEFGHSFVEIDMEIGSNRKFIDDKSYLFTDEVQRTLENTGIGSFHTYLIEHIVRLLEIRVAENYIGEDEAQKLRDINAAFIWLPQMEELIVEKYESDTEKYKNLSDFIPELLTVVK